MAFPHRDLIKEALIEVIRENGGEIHTSDAYDLLAKHFGLTDEDLNKRRPGTNELAWPNEVRWARDALVTEKKLLPPSESGWGNWKLTKESGSTLASSNSYPLSLEFPQIYADLKDEGVFDPANISDARDIILRTIVQRRGQHDFRMGLLTAYESKCAITSETFIGVLEAAHIIPYQGSETNVTSNGLLLRADIHTLFDLFLLSVNPSTYLVEISQKLQGTGYMKYHGRSISLPKDSKLQPSVIALKEHWNKLQR